MRLMGLPWGILSASQARGRRGGGDDDDECDDGVAGPRRPKRRYEQVHCEGRAAKRQRRGLGDDETLKDEVDDGNEDGNEVDDGNEVGSEVGGGNEVGNEVDDGDSTTPRRRIISLRLPTAKPE